MKKTLIVISLLAMFTLGALFVETAIAGQDNPVKIWPQNKNGPYTTMVVVDEDTGVNYIVVTSECSGYYSNQISVSVTPRLHSNGVLYTSK